MMKSTTESSAAAFLDMPCLILAGGLGTRLRPVLDDLPKPMAAVAGKSFLEYLIRWLRQGGMQRVILCTGYKSEKIQRYFKSGEALDVQISYSVEREPKG